MLYRNTTLVQSCIHCSTEYYRVGSVHKYVVLASDVGFIRQVRITFRYPGPSLNPMSWRLQEPRLHLNKLSIQKLGSDKMWVLNAFLNIVVIKKRSNVTIALFVSVAQFVRQDKRFLMLVKVIFHCYIVLYNSIICIVSMFKQQCVMKSIWLDVFFFRTQFCFEASEQMNGLEYVLSLQHLCYEDEE